MDETRPIYINEYLNLFHNNYSHYGTMTAWKKLNCFFLKAHPAEPHISAHRVSCRRTFPQGRGIDGKEYGSYLII